MLTTNTAMRDIPPNTTHVALEGTMQPNFTDEYPDITGCEPDYIDDAWQDRRYNGDLSEDCKAVANPNAILSGSEILANTFSHFNRIFGQPSGGTGDGKQSGGIFK